MKNFELILPLKVCEESGLKKQALVNSLTFHPNGVVAVGYQEQWMKKDGLNTFKVEQGHLNITAENEPEGTEATVTTVIKGITPVLKTLFADK